MKRIFSVGAVCLLLASCGDSVSPDGVSGTYDLTSVNGTAMPSSITIVEQGVSIQYTFSSGTWTLRADGTYTLSFSSEVTADGVTVSDTHTETGTYTIQEPTTLNFSDSVGDPFSASLVSGRLTVIEDVFTFVFEKQ